MKRNFRQRHVSMRPGERGGTGKGTYIILVVSHDDGVCVCLYVEAEKARVWT